MKKIPATELILNPDGSIYHLALHPEQLAENIIIAGDPGRVAMISKHFDFIEHEVKNREFVTHTGIFSGKRISVISTGIGTDNIDIFLNEADALVNIDLKTREVKKKKSSLNIIRIGTSGALQKNISVDSFVVSSHGLGLDGLLNFYRDINKINEKNFSSAFIKQTRWAKEFSYPYFVSASEKLLSAFSDKSFTKGITATAPGFYAPQGRTLRLSPSIKNLERKLSAFSYQNHCIVNFEMETSALYGLSKLLGHHACTVCVIVGNRLTKKFSDNYKPAMEKLIQLTLERLTSLC